MKISVITVSFKAGEKLSETVLKTLKQTFTDYEILVKDGGSPDDSVQTLVAKLEEAGYAKETVKRGTAPDETEKTPETVLHKDGCASVRVISEGDKGIYDAMNHAVSYAKGEYVIFMNCGDSFYDDEVLKNAAKVMEQNPDRGIYYGNAYFETIGEILYQPAEITESVCFRHVPNHQACFFARSLWDEEGFDLKYKIRADYDFFLRSFFENKIRPCYLDITVSSYEGGGYSESKENRKRDKAEHREITERHMGKKRAAHYRRIMILTLQPLRTWIAQKSIFAGAYNALRKKLLAKGK